MKWSDGSKSWEPEDNVMDDDLVDEFEASQQKAAYEKDNVKAGASVEVMATMEGFHFT